MHLHTTYSDGTDSPERVVARAAELEIAALAITDHDTVDGVSQARDAAARAGIAFLTGTEISTRFDNVDVHVLGLGIDIGTPVLIEALAKMKEARETRALRMVERLAARGMAVEVNKPDDGGVFGRMHVARALHAAGHVKTVQHAFDKFLKPGKPGYVGHPRLDCADAIALIHAAGGLAFLAHPGIGAPTRKLQSLLGLPFDGIECYHSKHSPGKIEMLLQVAREHNLLVTGGSDCHGDAKGRAEMGKVRLPMEYFKSIRERLGIR